ncbi:MAG: lysophospholipase [Steroidobacteraceae bacterium]
MRHLEDSFVGVHGLRLYTQAWLPEGAVVAVVVLSHGLAEHSGRYGELVALLVQRGYAVHALDHVGHGRSEGRRSYVDRFGSLVDDLAQLMRAAVVAHPGRPLLLLGHSLGGAIAFACALEHQHELKGLILSAPALGATAVPRFRLIVARILSRVAPYSGALKLPADAVSRDPAVVDSYEHDPLVYRGAVPARTAVELLDAMSQFPARALELRVPVLALHGTADRLVPLAAVQPVYDRIGSADKSIVLYPGLYHEVFHEPERAAVFADLEGWLSSHV